jgi:hypothetical protein
MARSVVMETIRKATNPVRRTEKAKPPLWTADGNNTAATWSGSAAG